MSHTKKTAALPFSVGDTVVYPTHGVGEVTAIQNVTIAGMTLETYVLFFEREKMEVKVPVARAESQRLRPVASEADIKGALKTLTTKPRASKAIWSKRATEYEAKINSGDITQLCEVIRDLYRNASQPEPSYSERQIWENAVGRLAREYAVAMNTTITNAVRTIENALAQAGKRRASEKEVADVEADAA